MPYRIVSAFFALAALVGIAPSAHAQQHFGHDGGNTVQADTELGAGIESTGVVNGVDPKARTVNLTHAPIPALGWPSMTMDLAVAEGVDLSAIDAGEKVTFTLDRGADDIYMITGIDPVD